MVDVIYELASGKRISISVAREVKSTLDEDDRNIRRQERKWRRHIILTDLVDSLYYESLDHKEETSSMSIRKEGYEQLYLAINMLTLVQQRRIRMYYFNEFPYRLIAELEGTCVSSVVQSIQLAITKLKRHYQD